MKRRSFLIAVGGTVGSQAIPVRAAEAREKPPADTTLVPRRALGRTGEKISIIGYPGLGLVHDDQKVCTASIHRAFERGVNYFDVAPSYGNGDCEIKMGIGLEGLPRDKYFLACKTKMRDKEGARKELERSLQRLKTDRFDLYQLHALFRPEEVMQALGPGGAMETFQKAKEEGKIRFFGFSAHTRQAAMTAMRHFRFDTVMFPINFVEYFTLGFGKEVLALAAEQGAAVLAIKPMSRGLWPAGVEQTRKWWYRPIDDDREIDLALRFALSNDPVAAGLPPAWLDLVAKAIDRACEYRPITEAETDELRKLAQSCESVFRKEEQKVAHGLPGGSCYPDSPHGCGGEWV
jgi:predicted aldo/keto reductase-like oxidoreductase